MKIFFILKEILEDTPEFQQLVDSIIDKGGKYLGKGDYGVVYKVGDRVIKITTDAEELEDAQQIKEVKTKYFVYIYDVEIIKPKLGIITMELLEPFTADPSTVPLAEIDKEAEELGIYPDLEGPGGRIKMDNVMQDRRGNIKVIDV